MGTLLEFVITEHFQDKSCPPNPEYVQNFSITLTPQQPAVLSHQHPNTTFRALLKQNIACDQVLGNEI